MFLNIMNNITNMDKNSRFLLIIIAIISVLLILIFIFNYLSSRKIKKQNKISKAYKKKLIEEINKEAQNIEPVKKVSVSKTKIKEEIEVLDDNEEVLEVTNEENESDIDRILKEIKKANKEENLNLTEFEKEQEETAIISYDELCERAGVKKKIYKVQNTNVSKNIDNTINNDKKYKPSKIVSPIFGVQEENINEEIDLDQTFLKTLKEFRSSLD